MGRFEDCFGDLPEEDQRKIRLIIRAIKKVIRSLDKENDG